MIDLRPPRDGTGMTAVLSCRHYVTLQGPAGLPDTAICPQSGYERDIDRIISDEE